LFFQAYITTQDLPGTATGFFPTPHQVCTPYFNQIQRCDHCKMAADLADGYVQTSEYSPFTKLPEDVDGFIEVETLVDIHKYLSTSEKSDDIDLAAWVKEHYLQGPLVEIGRPIRDTEGFQKLDRAYRRTRQLTGKAQDKWPFFNKNWKKMPSNVVKSAVHAANGTNLPVVRGEVRDTPKSNGFDGQHGKSCVQGSALQQLTTPRPHFTYIGDAENS
jgi:hypothetical protein